MYYVFDVRNLVLYSTREAHKFIDYKILLRLQCKNTFHSAFLGKKIIKIEQELTLEQCFEKLWFYMKYTVKNYSHRILFARLCIFEKFTDNK